MTATLYRMRTIQQYKEREWLVEVVRGLEVLGLVRMVEFIFMIVDESLIGFMLIGQ